MFSSAQTAARVLEREVSQDLLKVKVDEEDCIGCGICSLMCPEVFKLEGKKAVVISEAADEETASECRRAARDCPMDAISIEYQE